jgi:hypothetical protein
MTTFQTTKTYAQPLPTVLALLCDEAHTRAKYEQLGHRGFEALAWELGEDLKVLHGRRRVPLDAPGFARKFLGSENVVEQRERWQKRSDGTWASEWSVAVQGAPITLQGTAVLRPTATGCVQEIRGEARCSVPLVGGKVADFVARDAERGMEREDAIDRAALARG